MINEEEFEEFVFTQALENAVSFEGKANPKALIGRAVAKFPDMKKDMNTYMSKINNIAEQINSFTVEEQKEKLLKLNPKFFTQTKEKKVKKEGLPNLPNHEGKLRVRFAPAPSGRLHIGHAYNIVYNSEYVKEYGGEFILRIEDTNPENINIENYDRIIEDVKWLTEDNVDEIYYQSDRIETYYKYLRTLVESGAAYVCECEAEEFKSFNDASAACPHREIPVDKQLENYEKFFNGKYKDGDAVLRFKADLTNKNPALRDFPIARMKSGEHTRVGTKYNFWPMYNFCAAIDDATMDINYVIRGKDGEINGQRQDMIKKSLGLKTCNYFHIGRVKFEDIELSKTKISERIKNKEYENWEDPRVPSLASYRKRGFRAEAFRKMIVAQGISKRDSRVSSEEYHKSLHYYNKQILEKEAERFFFVHNPKVVHIENRSEIKEKIIKCPKHPEDHSKGFRELEIGDHLYIDSIDFNELEVGDEFRLMHFGNFKILDKTKTALNIKFTSKEFSRDLPIKRNIHFVPYKDHEEIIIVLQDNSKLKGIAEKLDNFKEHDSVQFERFGFVNYIEKNDEKRKVFYFTQR